MEVKFFGYISRSGKVVIYVFFLSKVGATIWISTQGELGIHFNRVDNLFA